MVVTPDRPRHVWAVSAWPPLARYFAALALVLATTGCIALLNSDRGILVRVSIENPGTVYIATVTLAAVFFGLGPALVTMVASMLAVLLFFPRYESLERAVVLTATTLIIIGLAEWQRRAQERAERAQAKFEAIVEGMSDAVMVVDAAGNATDVNPAAVAMLGAPDRREALQFVTHSRDDGTPFTDEYGLLLRALSGEGAAQTDVLIPNDPDGPRTVSAVANAMHDAGGRIIGAVSVSRDMTDRVRAEQERERLLTAIEQDQRSTQLILDTAPVAIGVIRPGDLLVLSANASFNGMISDLAGKPFTAGMSVLDVLPDFETSEFVRQLRRATAEERTLTVTGYAARIPAGRYFDWTMKPLIWRDGTQATLTTLADVTERMRGEQEREALLRQVERQAAQLAATFEAMLDGVAVYDADGNVLHRNEAFYRLLHLDPEQAPLLWEAFIRELHLRKADGTQMTQEETHSFRALRGETIREEVILVRDKRGRDRFMSQNATPIRAADGTIIGAVVVFHDVTERLEEERERERLLTLVEERRGFAQAIFDTVPVCLAVVDTDALTFSAANPAFLESVPEPYRLHGVNDRAVTAVLPHTRDNGFVDQLRQVGETGEPFMTSATMYAHPTRGTTSWNETMIPLSTSDPDAHHILYIAADVTEQVEGQQRIAALAQEAAARASQLEVVFGALTEGLILTDAHANIVRSNEAVARVLGLDGQPLPPLREFVERFAMRDADDGVIPQQNRVASAALGGTTMINQLRRFRNARGEERWMSVSGSPVRDETGTIMGVVMTMRDVTEERRGIEERERLLREVEEGRWFAQTVIESAPVGIAVFGTDPDVTTRIVNEQFVRLLDEPWRGRGIAGAGIRDYLPGAEEIGVIRMVRSVVETGEPVFVREFQFDGFTRGTVYFDWSIVPLREGGDRVTGLLALVTDVTDRVLSRQRIEELADDAAQRAIELETIIASMPDGVAIYAPDGRLLLMNAAGRQISGVESDLNEPIEETITRNAIRYPDGRPIPLDELPRARALRGERVSAFEFISRTLRGDIYLLSSSAPITNVTGTITSAVVVFSDITERKRQEGLTTRLGRLLDASSNEIYVYDATSLRYLQVNEGARRNLGYTQEELMGMTSLDIKPEFTAETFATLIAPLRTGERDEVVFESVHRRKDGSIYPIEARIQRSQTENPPVFVSIVQDITERHIAEQQREQLLREIDERRRDASQRASELETVIASIADGVLFTDTAGRIVLENVASRRLTGRVRSKQGETYQEIGKLKDPSGAPIGDEDLPLTRALRGETVAEQVVVVWRPDLNADRFLMCSSAPVRTPDGTITGAVAVFRDITAMKELEQMKDEFVSIAAHELRTPLTAIKGYADLLDRRLSVQGGREGDRKSLAIIRKQSARLAGLVNEMLDVSRIEAGRLDLNAERFDLSGLVSEVVGNMAVSIEKHVFKLSSEPGIAVNGDTTRIEQVLINLISNAITYSPEGGEIGVRVWAEYGTASVSVCDEGVGIAEEELPHLFDRFYRAPRAGVMRSGGMGLGLYICHEIITRHGGMIHAESIEGIGSTFTFSLPLAEEGLGTPTGAED